MTLSVLPTVSKINAHADVYFYLLIYVGTEKFLVKKKPLVPPIETWKEVIDRKGYGDAVLMNLSKTFDTINYDLLLAKLHAYGFTNKSLSLIKRYLSKSLSLIKSYLSNRWQRAKVNTSFSSWSELLLGVPQGYVLQPLLFNIYLNDLFYLIECTNVCNYADDTTFPACDSDLKDLITRLEHDPLLAIEWFQANYRTLNKEKCHLCISGQKQESFWANIARSKTSGNNDRSEFTF